MTLITLVTFFSFITCLAFTVSTINICSICAVDVAFSIYIKKLCIIYNYLYIVEFSILQIDHQLIPLQVRGFDEFPELMLKKPSSHMLHVTLIYPSRQVQLPLVASHSLPFIVPSTWQLQPEKVVKMIIIKNFQNQSLRSKIS